MSKIVTYNSVSILNDGVKVICDLQIPILGEEPDSVYDERSETIFPIMTGQYVGAVSRVIRDYENSMLPDKFIVGQEILVTGLPVEWGLHGVFNLVGDAMIVDANTICDIDWRIPASFLFGHEMGHKIAKYTDTREVYGEIADVLGISSNGNKELISETFADECGNMVSSEIHDHGILPVPLDPDRREGIKIKILKSLYRI